MPHTNLQRLTKVANLLRPLLNELVFVGGSVTGLLITDAAVGEPRATSDVDAIAEITSYAAYTTFGDRLRQQGFAEDERPGAPVCRWVHTDSILDVMPLDENILGFSNRWYRHAMARAVGMSLDADLKARVIAAPYFIATKLEAFKGRGHEDFLNSRDVEDFVYVVDGRPSLGDEVRLEPVELRKYISNEVRVLLSNPQFHDALPWLLYPDRVSQARKSKILQRLEAMRSI